MTYNHKDEMISQSPEETQSIGRILGNYCHPGDIILLVGDLGTGKTCLTQGILWGLGVEEYARSPTFVLMSEYHGRLPLYHMDLYRLNSISEIADLGLEEYLDGDGISVIEWADKGSELFSQSYLMITMTYLHETKRMLNFETNDRHYTDIIETIKLDITTR